MGGDALLSFAQQQLSPEGYIGSQMEDTNNRKKNRLLLQLKSAEIEKEMEAKQAIEAAKFSNEGYASPGVSSFLAQQAGMTPETGFKASEKDAAILAGLAGKKLTANNKGGKKGFMGHEANLFLGAPVFGDEEFVDQNRYNAAKDQVNREQASPAAKQQYTSIQDAKRYIDQMQKDHDAIQATGWTGPVAGRLAKMGNAVTGGEANPAVDAYTKTRIGLAGRLKGVAGEAGRLTDQDVERMLGLVSGVERGSHSSQAGFDTVRQILSGAENNITGMYPTFARQIAGRTDKAPVGYSPSAIDAEMARRAGLRPQQGKK